MRSLNYQLFLDACLLKFRCKMSLQLKEERQKEREIAEQREKRNRNTITKAEKSSTKSATWFIVRTGGLITYERSGETESISTKATAAACRSEKSFIFRIPVALTSAISRKFHPFSPGRSLKARRWENRTVNPFAILSISLTTIKVMSNEIDCPHKIVSSPFCGADSAKRTPPLGSAKQMTAVALFRATLSTRRYREVRLDLCERDSYVLTVPRTQACESTRGRDYRKAMT